jgi:hypothetical protein
MSVPAEAPPRPAVTTVAAAAPGTPVPADRRLHWGPPTLAAGVLALAAARPIGDNSFLTHLATGRVLLDRGWPQGNPFLASAPDDFPIPSWWWSGLLAVAEQVAGHAGIRLLTVALAALLGVLVVRLAAGRDGLVASVLPPAVAVLVLLPFVTPRPHLAGFLLLGVALVVRGERRRWWWLIPVFATWVNVHGTWLYGLVVLGLVAGADLLDGPHGRRRSGLRRDAALLGGAVLGVAVGGALYPERFRLVGLPLEQLGGGAAREVIRAYNEWRPVGPASAVFWTLVLLGAAAAGGAVWRRRPGAFLAAVLLCGMGLSAQRLVPVAAISLVPLAASTLDGLGTIPAPSGRAARTLGAVGAVLVALALLAAVRGPHLDHERFPVAAVDRLEARGLVADPDVSVVHQDFVGNYLEWRYGTDAHAYVDDRPDLDTAVDYVDLVRLRPNWERVLERADAQVVLWERDHPLDRALAEAPSWRRVEVVDGFSIWCSEGVSACR